MINIPRIALTRVDMIVATLYLMYGDIGSKKIAQHSNTEKTTIVKIYGAIIPIGELAVLLGDLHTNITAIIALTIIITIRFAKM
jgi:hypothetical protein